MKNYLILINNAPQMGFYHKGLGDELKKRGDVVIYAFSDYMPIYRYNLNMKNDIHYVFSDYFHKNEKNTEIPIEYRNINWWKTFFSDYDRSIVHFKGKVYNKEYYETLIPNLICYFDEIIKKHQIDFIIYENISNSFAYVCYEVGKIRCTSYRGYLCARLPHRFELHTEEFGMVERFKKVFNNFKLSDIDAKALREVDQYLSKYEEKNIPTLISRNNPLSATYSLKKRYLNSEKFNVFFRIVSFKLNQKYESKYSYQIQDPGITAWKSVISQIKKKIKSLIGYHSFDVPIKNERFVLYPLHMKPESSTSVLARHFSDDMAFIRNIAFNIPMGYKLYVKEHYINYGTTPFSFYNEIRKIPNVRLISSNEDTKELIKSCKALITLSGTMGLEALLMHKKVILFGNVFYEAHPNCIKVNNFEDVFQILSTLKEPIPDYKLSQRFIGAYYKSTYEGDIYFSFSSESNTLRFSLPVINALKSYEKE